MIRCLLLCVIFGFVTSIPKPDLRFQSAEEELYLKLHKCQNTGEAFSSSYLITREYLLYVKLPEDLSIVNCELASFMMFNRMADPRLPDQEGTIIQSLDVLDISVIHLSAYERLQRRYEKDIIKLSSISSTGWNIPQIDVPITNRSPIAWTTNVISNSLGLLQSHHEHNSFDSKYFQKTVVIMPYLGSETGSGQSNHMNRLLYLKLCFWSFYARYRHIVVFVMTMKDYHFLKSQSDLPFYDIILLQNLPTTASLPVASVIETQARIRSLTWRFEYIFYTESDQVS